jgi:glycosyltransferase involved in cell wall biosynthesis
MKILFAYDYPESGTESVLQTVAEALDALGHLVDIVVTDGGRDPGWVTDRSLSKYDVAHFWNTRAQLPFKDSVIPWGVTIHGFLFGAEAGYLSWLREAEPDWVHVMDSYVQQLLGRHHIYCRRTPQVISRGDWKPLPPPEEFTLGFLGEDPDFDGFDIITEIGARTGIPVFGHNASIEWIPRKELAERFFAHISVFVDWHFGACGPVTAQEALLCGRPILVPPGDTMEQILRHGEEGCFFDGSAEDGARQLLVIQKDYERMTRLAPRAQLNDPRPVAEAFVAKWKELV